jgi:glutamate-5-semialdehyde dehydrogenase
MDFNMMGSNAKAAEKILSVADTALKNKALEAMANSLISNAADIISANEIDLSNSRQNGMSDSLLDRLRLNSQRIDGMADGIRQVAALGDPIGEVIEGSIRPNGMRISKVRVPLGVVGIIFEARPNVTSDAAALCLKSGNACILRGGKEAIRSNTAIADILRNAVKSAGLPADCIQLVTDTSRESANQMMRMNKYLDVLIPRGGAGLIRTVVENSTVPVIETGVGNCHVYVDKTADIDMAADIIFNAKTSRPSVCNAIETILVHKDIAAEALPAIKARLDEKNVEIRGCKRTAEILGESIVPATENDYAVEFLDYILACKVVDSIDEAVEHISKYSTGHSESIVTSDYFCAEKFTAEVDSAAVYVNCSTRFTDGGEFGLGAEIGISTQKLHARGPMGVKQLTSTKFIIHGDGQIR